MSAKKKTEVRDPIFNEPGWKYAIAKMGKSIAEHVLRTMPKKKRNAPRKRRKK